MSLIAWLLESTGSFDKLRQGRYDEGSACGFVQECEDVKDCIFRICTPHNAAYGGQFYDDCINFCNSNPDSPDVGSFLCEDPQNAWNLYNYECKGENVKKQGTINILGRDVKIINVASFVVFVFVLYFIATKSK